MGGEGGRRRETGKKGHGAGGGECARKLRFPLSQNQKKHKQKGAVPSLPLCASRPANLQSVCPTSSLPPQRRARPCPCPCPWPCSSLPPSCPPAPARRPPSLPLCLPLPLSSVDELVVVVGRQGRDGRRRQLGLVALLLGQVDVHLGRGQGHLLCCFLWCCCCCRCWGVVLLGWVGVCENGSEDDCGRGDAQSFGGVSFGATRRRRRRD